jgi:PKD domain
LRSSRSRTSVNCRSGALPGRRFAFTLALALAAMACWTASASADQTVVSATIYASGQGTVTHQSVGLQTLAGCPAYAGSNPIYLYPPGQPYQLTATSWTVATVLTCGLQIPLGDVTSIQVLNPSNGFEAPLANADLSDPTRYRDSQAPDALPAISVDGSEDQTTYLRPFRDGSDANARDAVTENGAPITLVVYVNGPPLTVEASAQTLSSTTTTTTAKLSATVHASNGSPVPASALTWSWSFGDGASSTAATPEHRFAAGTYDVTVQVADVGSGAGGTATLQFGTPASATPGHKNQTGGKKPTTSKSATGSEGGRQHANGPAGKAGVKRSGTSDEGQPKPKPAGQSTTPTATSTTPTTSSPTTSTTTPAAPTTTATTPTTTSTTTTTTTSTTTATSSTPRPVPRPRSKRTTPRRPPVPALAGPLVTGRLISDVTPLPVDSSPLVHVTPAAAAAPAVAQATRTASLSALGAVAVVIVLLGLGVWRELRGRRRWRAASRDH